MDTLSIVGRKSSLYVNDLQRIGSQIDETIQKSSFLIIGGAGTIGSAVSKEIFKRQPKLLHVVDISENNLVELVRTLRSTTGYIDGEFSTFAIDYASDEFLALVQNNSYDYIFNLAALKHVRSEKDSYTLMRMLTVNIINTVKSYQLFSQMNAKKYFAVSTDKAANPVNMMGASKKLMEIFLMSQTSSLPVTTARFANVAFSDGSLLHGFKNRIFHKQPISAPIDIRRYFVTPEEAGQLCLISGIQGKDREIYFPKLSAKIELVSIKDVAVRYIESLGYKPYICSTEDEAREESLNLINKKMWPCYFFNSDTSGEKPYEEFYTASESINLTRYEDIGVIEYAQGNLAYTFDEFNDFINKLKMKKQWNKSQLSELMKNLLDDYCPIETGKYLESRM